MNSLKDICFERIKDNYWYGLFGDFKLIIDINTGYFNASKLCKDGGKRFKNWLRNKESKQLIEYISKNLERPNTSFLKNGKITYKIVSKVAVKYNYSGIYVCDDLITSIACWISPEFTVKVNKIVKDYYTDEYIKKYKNSENKLLEIENKLEQIEKKNIELQNENEKYKDLEEDITPKTRNLKKLHRFAVIQKNEKESDYPFYIVRCQKESYNRTINDLKVRYPNLEISQEIRYNPNSINLFNRMKETITDIDTNFNHLRLNNDFKLEDLIRDIEILNNEKI